MKCAAIIQRIFFVAYALIVTTAGVFGQDVFSVTVAAAGEFSATYSDADLQTRTETTLKIIGPVNADDIKRVKNALSANFVELDFSEVKILGEGKYSASGRTYEMREDTLTEYLFCNIPKLKKIILPTTLKAIADNALSSCGNLSGVEIPSSVLSIGEYAFAGSSLADGIVLNEGLLSIGNRAFSQCKMTSFTLPGSVTSVGNGAFYDCTSLVTVVLNDNITKLQDELFSGCKALEKFDFPSALVSVGDRVFYGCTGITSFDLPEGVSSIGEYAFGNTAGIKEFVFPETVVSIGKNVFRNSAIETVTLPSKITLLPEYLFRDCSKLQHADIPVTVSEMPKGLFYNCSALQSVTFSNAIECIPDEFMYRCTSMQHFDIPVSVKRIGKNAFYDCDNIIAIDLPDGLTYIGDYAFGSCSALRAVELPVTVDTICANAFQGCTSTDIKLHKGLSLKYIGSYAFNNCDNLQMDTLPSTLQNIESFAFSGCDSVKSVVVPASIVSLSTSLFGNCTSLAKVEFASELKNIGSSAFSGCMSLKDIEIPVSCNSIGQYAFKGCTALVYIKIPDGITELPSQIFADCTSLDSVSLPSGLKKVGSYSFSGCSALRAICLPEAVTTIESNAFYKCKSLKNFIFPTNVTTIGSSAISGCEALEEVVLPQNITSLPLSLFADCKALKSVTVPDGVKTLSTSLFSGCVSLQTLILPEGITELPGNLLYNCSSLTDIKIPSTVTTIGSSVFSGCVSLGDIVLPESVSTIGYAAFSKCTSLISVILPDSVKQISSSLFRGCSNLCTVTVADDLTMIGADAFANCSSLDNFIIPATVTSIGANAFQNTISLKSVVIPEGVTELYSVFSGSGLKEVKLPSTMKKISSSFANCDSLVSLSVNEGCTEISSVCMGCDNLKQLYLPSTITKVAKGEFSNAAALTEVHLKAETLPECNNSNSSVGNNKVVLYVPKGCGEKYKNNSCWSYFKDIIEEDYSLADINDDEWRLLQRVPELTDGDNWKHRWTFGATREETAVPYGVTVSDGHVVSVNLSGNNLQGTLPSEIFEFPYLKRLTLFRNNLAGDIETVCGSVSHVNDSIVDIDVSDNNLSGNLYGFMEVAPNVVSLKANRNRISDIRPLLPATVTTLEFKGQDLRDVFTIDYSELFALRGDPSLVLPSVLTYYNSTTDEDYYKTSASFYMIDEENENNIKPWLVYLAWYSDEGKKSAAYGYSFNNYSYDGWYMRPSGYVVDAFGSLDSDVSLRHRFKIRLDYEVGDVDFNTEVNISDVQRCLNYALDSTYYKRTSAFNFYAANVVNSDNTINVQDVVANINLLLSQGVSTALLRRKVDSMRAAAIDDVQHEAVLYVDGENLVLETSRPVAAMDITLSGGNVEWLPSLSSFLRATKEGNGSRSIFYSFSGEEIPAGTTVLAHTDCCIVNVMLVDIDGKEVSSAIGSGGVTSNGEIIFDADGRPEVVCDLYGRRINISETGVDRLSPGIYIINGKKVIVK